MYKFAVLELRKQRLLFFGMALAFLASLAAWPWVASRVRHSAPQALQATLLFWTLIGLPGIAALFGGASGAGLRAEPDHSAEEVLPLSPERRVFGAFAANSLYVLALGLLVLAVSFVASPGWRMAVLTVKWESIPFARALFALTLFTLVYTLAVSLICAYVLRHGILGGLLGILTGGGSVFCLACGWTLEARYGIQAPFGWLGVLAVLLTLVGIAFALCRAAVWVELQPAPAWKRILWISLGLGSGLAACGSAFLYTSDRLGRALRFVSSDPYYNITLYGGRWVGAGPKGRKAANQGALMRSLKGDLVWVTSEGRREVWMSSEDRPFLDFEDSWFGGRFRTAVWDEEGTLWLIVRPKTPEVYKADQIWRKRSGEGFKFHAYTGIAVGDWIRVGSQLGMVAWGGREEHHVYAPLPAGGQKPAWRPVGKGSVPRLFVLQAWVREGLAAEVQRDRRTLVHRPRGKKVRVWKLPGRAFGEALHGGVYPAFTGGGPDYFSLPVELGGSREGMAVCYPDGSVKLAWSGTHEEWYRLAPLFGEGFFGWVSGGRAGTLHIAGRDGRFFPPLDMVRILQQFPPIPGRSDFWPIVLRLEGTMAWMILRDRYLAQVDLRSGEVVQSWTLPDFHRIRMSMPAFHVADGGFFLHEGRRLHFIRWDGLRKSLGPA